jgi:hypothetical protein
MLHVRYVYFTMAKRSIFIRDKPIFSLQRMLHKKFCRKGPMKKRISGRVP